MWLLPSPLLLLLVLVTALVLLELGWVDPLALRRWALWPLEGDDARHAPMLFAGLALAAALALGLGTWIHS